MRNSVDIPESDPSAARLNDVYVDAEEHDDDVKGEGGAGDHIDCTVYQKPAQGSRHY